jgi:hypothetical protein
MRKLSVLMMMVAALAVVSLNSCKKDKFETPEKAGIGVVKGHVVLEGEKDMLLKSGSIYTPVSRRWTCYWEDKGSAWKLIDSTMFLVGSSAYYDWKPGTNPTVLPATSPVYGTYFPAVDSVKIISETLNSDGNVIYRGIKTFHPTDGFSITMTGRQDRDADFINVDSLHISKFTFNVTATIKTVAVDANKTITGNSSTDNGWPNLSLSNDTIVTTTAIIATANATTVNGVSTPAGNISLYDGLGRKVVSFKIHYSIMDKSNKIKEGDMTVAKTNPGIGSIVRMVTTKKGYNDSGTITITDLGISFDTIRVVFN